MSKRTERDRSAISDVTREKLENVFRDWLAANSHALVRISSLRVIQRFFEPSKCRYGKNPNIVEHVSFTECASPTAV